MIGAARLLWLTLAAFPLISKAETLPLPIPPIPPERPPAAEFAPVPDHDAATPHLPRDQHGIAVTPGLFSPPEQYRGDGFAPGSTAQPVQERRLWPIPGVRLSVPIN